MKGMRFFLVLGVCVPRAYNNRDEEFRPFQQWTGRHGRPRRRDRGA